MRVLAACFTAIIVLTSPGVQIYLDGHVAKAGSSVPVRPGLHEVRLVRDEDWSTFVIEAERCKVTTVEADL